MKKKKMSKRIFSWLLIISVLLVSMPSGSALWKIEDQSTGVGLRFMFAIFYDKKPSEGGEASI